MRWQDFYRIDYEKCVLSCNKHWRAPALNPAFLVGFVLRNLLVTCVVLHGLFDFVHVLCTQCCMYTWIVHYWWSLRFSLTFIIVVMLLVVYIVNNVSVNFRNKLAINSQEENIKMMVIFGHVTWSYSALTVVSIAHFVFNSVFMPLSG